VSDLRQTSVGPAQTVWIFNPSSGEEEEGNETPGPELTAFVTGVLPAIQHLKQLFPCVWLVALAYFGGSFEALL